MATEERITAASDSQSRGVYAISVAAELVGTGQQKRRIAELLSAGLHLSGIRLVLVLEKENETLRSQLHDQILFKAPRKIRKIWTPLRNNEGTCRLVMQAVGE
ncbi:hypothetical protein ACX80D_07510 [Arthrobacter sp. Sr24]